MKNVTWGTVGGAVPTMSRTMTVDGGLGKRLARDHQRTRRAPVWIGTIAIAVLLVGVPFFFTGSPRTLYLGAIPILIAAIAFATIRALMTHHLERVIAGIYPRGAEISAEVTDSGLTLTTPIVRTEIRARMLSGVSVRANSVQLRLPGATGPAMVIPRELLDDDDVARLRSVIARAQGR